ncbi:MAG: type II toxin-antitoxin system RelB/DinJ family antitoxin [Atopobiaceae bacterium]|nr:type II toxin-antitoxin system RelB/DinJ family antitoxin [Atopobiaceae bacterium]
MARTSAVYARIDTNLKQDAEAILAQLGISPSSAIQMLYSQVVLNEGLPFVPRMPRRQPLAAGSLSEEELYREVMSAAESIEIDGGVSEEEADALFAKEFGI